MSTLKQLLDERRQQYKQRETLQKELSSLFNQKDHFLKNYQSQTVHYKINLV